MASPLLSYLVLLPALACLCAVAEAPPKQSRQIQNLWIKDGYGVAVDLEPAWEYDYRSSPAGEMLVLETPDLYYPPIVINVRKVKNYQSTGGYHHFKKLARSALASSAEQFGYDPGIRPQIENVQYKHTEGWRLRFPGKVEGVDRDMYVQLVRSSAGDMLLATIFGLPDTLPHASHALDRVFNSVTFIEVMKHGSAMTEPVRSTTKTVSN